MPAEGHRLKGHSGAARPRTRTCLGLRSCLVPRRAAPAPPGPPAALSGCPAPLAETTISDEFPLVRTGSAVHTLQYHQAVVHQTRENIWLRAQEMQHMFASRQAAQRTDPFACLHVAMRMPRKPLREEM